MPGISASALKDYEAHLICEEKSDATREKYLRDMAAFAHWLGERELNKENCLAWKQKLVAEGYAPRSVNSMLASLNSLLAFLGRYDCRVKTLRLQRSIYCREERELSKEEYMRLLAAAKSEQLRLLLQTMAGTGIRVSELQHFTVEALQRGEVLVSCKGKSRTVLLPGKLRKLLLSFARRQGIESGPVFIGRHGQCLDRSRIWAQMKSLCARAKVAPGKVFPHNLRKLFARTFYKIEKDIAKLADILGHGCIETTRIYIMTSGREHRQKMERLGLVV